MEDGKIRNKRKVKKKKKNKKAIEKMIGFCITQHDAH